MNYEPIRGKTTNWPEDGSLPDDMSKALDNYEIGYLMFAIVRTETKEEYNTLMRFLASHHKIWEWKDSGELPLEKDVWDEYRSLEQWLPGSIEEDVLTTSDFFERSNVDQRYLNWMNACFDLWDQE